MELPWGRAGVNSQMAQAFLKKQMRAPARSHSRARTPWAALAFSLVCSGAIAAFPGTAESDSTLSEQSASSNASSAPSAPATAAASPRVLLHRAWKNIEAWDVAGARRDLEALKAALAHGAEGGSLPTKPAVTPGAAALLEAQVLFEESRLDEAVEALAVVDAELPDMPGAENTVRLIRETARLTEGHLTAESAHFRLRYPPGKDALLVPLALETLEAERAALGEALGHVPPGKVTVEIYPTKEGLSAATTLPLSAIQATGTVAICKFSKLMAMSPKALVHGYTWRDTLSHEYVHLVVSQMSRNGVPVWVHEGLAKFYETAWRSSPGDGGISPASAAFLAQEARKNALIPFEKMSPSLALLPTHEDAALGYAEAFTAIEYAAEKFGTQALQKLISAYGQGAPDAQAFRAATGESFQRFVAGWKAHVQKRPHPTEPLGLDAEKRRFGVNGSGEDGTQGEQPDKPNASETFTISDFPDLKNPEAKNRAHLGELLRIRGRHRAAVEEFRAAYTLTGAVSPMLSNRYAQALLGAAAASSPTSALTKAESPEAMRTLAESVLRESLLLYPGWPRTLKALGELVAGKAGKEAEARQLYEEAVGVDPFDPALHRALLTLCGPKALSDKNCVSREETALAILRGERFEWPVNGQFGGDGSAASGQASKAALDKIRVRLTVESRPFGHIDIDGRDTGRTTPATFELPAGQHSVRVFQESLNLDERREVVLVPGTPAVLRVLRQPKRSSQSGGDSEGKGAP